MAIARHAARPAGDDLPGGLPGAAPELARPGREPEPDRGGSTPT